MLSDVQESRAKILVSYIDDVMTSGGFYRIQTLMDDCKNNSHRLQKDKRQSGLKSNIFIAFTVGIFSKLLKISTDAII